MTIYKNDIVDIDLESGSIHRSFLKHSIGKGDIKANRFGVRVYRNGEAVTLGSATCQGFFMAPDGTNLQIQGSSLTGVSGNVAYVILPQNCYAVEGQFCLAIKLIDSSAGITGTVRIVDGVVDNTGTTGAVSPTSTIPTSTEIIAAYNNAVGVIDNAVRFDITQSIAQAGRKRARDNIRAAAYTMLAPAFSESSTYAVGDCVIYDQDLWRCKAAVSTAGSWTGSTNWKKIALANEVGAMITIQNISDNKYRIVFSR